MSTKHSPPRSRLAAIAIAAGAIACIAAPVAAAQSTSPVTARDSAETSLTPTNLVFTALGSQLTISYDGRTIPRLVDHLRTRGLVGLVSCNAMVNGAATVAGAPVVWQKSKQSVTVSLGSTTGATRLVSCRLTEAGDSSDPIEVFFDAQVVEAQKGKVERTRAVGANETAARSAQRRLGRGPFADARGFASRLARALRRSHRGQSYAVARDRAEVRRRNVVYILSSSTPSRVVFAQRLASGRVVTTIVTEARIASRVAS